MNDKKEPVSEYATGADVEAFEASRAMFETLVEQLADPDGVFHTTHAELEELLTT